MILLSKYHILNQNNNFPTKLAHVQINISWEKVKFLSYFDSFLMYIDIHTKSQNFLKMSMFSNKIFTFSSSAQYFQKVNISHRTSIIFAQNWHFCTKIDVEKNTRHFTPKFARLDFITVLKNSLIYPKTNTFCIKWYFFTEGK